MILNSKFRKVLFVLAIFFAVSIGTALADDPTDPGGEPGWEWGPVGGNAPIDGGAIFFLIAGAAYGVKRLRGRKKNLKD